MLPLGVTEQVPDTEDDAFEPCGVYVAVPLDALLTVTVPLVTLTEPVVVPLTDTLFCLPVNVVVYVAGTAVDTATLSLNASAFNEPVEPNSCHFVPFQMNSILLYEVISPVSAAWLVPSITIVLVVLPSEISVVVTPTHLVPCEIMLSTRLSRKS